MNSFAENLRKCQAYKDLYVLGSSKHPEVCDDELQVYRIPSPDLKTPSISLVGGKGFSLIHMANAKIDVPPGFVLSTAFFTPWIEKLKTSSVWVNFAQNLSVLEKSPKNIGAGEDENIKSLSDALKSYARENLSLSPEMRLVVWNSWEVCGLSMVAVRSSSPEEDLGGASFAGGYETILGTTKDNLESAILTAFVSCLDTRVVMYKIAHGFSALTPSIAVVVQEQIDSEVAGVAFSVNPLSNCQTEVFINTNFGLGESVVSGIVSPDEFIVNKLTGNVVKKSLGSKELVVKLNRDGGITQSDSNAEVGSEFSISDKMASQICEQIIIIENLYSTAIDIEFGFSKGNLYILQARPITTNLPFPSISHELDEPHIYWDVSLGVQGLTMPMSVLSTSFLSLLPHTMIYCLSRYVIPPQKEHEIFPFLAVPEIGRFYFDMSVGYMHFTKFATEIVPMMDPLSADILSSLNLSEREIHIENMFRKWWFMLRVFVHAPYVRIARTIARIFWNPEQGMKAFKPEVASLFQKIYSMDRKPGDSFLEWICGIMITFIDFLLTRIMPRFLTWRLTNGWMKDLLREANLLECEEGISNLERLDRSLPGNVTVEMGLHLARIASDLRQLGPEVTSMTANDLEDALRDRVPSKITDKIKSEWREFLKVYGHRGDTELDMATPRYNDNSTTLVLQICQQLNIAEGSANDPAAIFHRCEAERKEAYNYFCKKLVEKHPASTLRKFKTLYRRNTAVGGFRETPKFNVIKVVDFIRNKLLRIGETFVSEGLLDSAIQVFDLTIVDVDKFLSEIEANPASRQSSAGETDRLLRQSNNNNDVVVSDSNKVADQNGFTPRQIRERRLDLWNKWTNYAQNSQELPRLIDSTGRIFRSEGKKPEPGKEDPNCLYGYPVSSGVVEGRIKVLTRPDEKPVLPGEILVARCTNPGWTPLFINAAAVILEVGGALQHGALVAREYGIPGVAGIAGLMTNPRLRDDTMVRVDGNSGVITIL